MTVQQMILVDTNVIARLEAEVARLAELTHDERTKMAACEKDDREWHDRMIKSLISHDAKGQNDE